MADVFRVKCSSCGMVRDISELSPCPKCKAAAEQASEGMLQIYRMGSPIGVAAGYGIYINGQPYGHIGNKQSIRIPLPYGTYNLHMTCGMTRRCKDLGVTLSPEAPAAYVKARIKAGFWSNTIFIEPASPEDMPPV